MAVRDSVIRNNQVTDKGGGDAFEELSPPQNGNLRFLNTLLISTSTSACATLGFDTLTFNSLG